MVMQSQWRSCVYIEALVVRVWQGLGMMVRRWQWESGTNWRWASGVLVFGCDSLSCEQYAVPFQPIFFVNLYLLCVSVFGCDSLSCEQYAVPFLPTVCKKKDCVLCVGGSCFCYCLVCIINCYPQLWVLLLWVLYWEYHCGSLLLYCTVGPFCECVVLLLVFY